MVVGSKSVAVTDYVHDIIINETYENLLNQLKPWKSIIEANGLKVNTDKTNIMICVRKQIPSMLLIKRGFSFKMQPMSWPSARCECNTL